MLLNVLLTRYAWLITDVPEILHSCYSWEFWLDNLSEYDILNLKMNVSGIKHSRDMIIDEYDNYDPCSKEFDCLCKIHGRLIESRLLSRLTS